MVEWQDSPSTYAIKKLALSNSLSLWSVYGGMAWVPFHLGNQEGGVVKVPSIIINVWWNDTHPIPLKLDVNGSAWWHRTKFSKSEGVIPKCPHSFGRLAYIIMPMIVGSIIVDCRWHDLMTNKIIHNHLKGVLESQLGNKKNRHVQRAKKVLLGKFAQTKILHKIIF
jgi:hypothetical protein